MIFRHTSSEPGMWRGWFEDGQVLELHWAKRGWDFGAGVLVHSNDADKGDKMLCLKLWRASAYIPLGVTAYDVDINCEPQWSVFASQEHGLWLRWRKWSKRFDWPWHLHTLAYEKQLIAGDGGAWVDVLDWDAEPHTEEYPYTYKLSSGETQKRTATVSKHRHVLTYRAFKKIGWPRWTKESIDVQFSDEVGEGSGSWKGGCIGCGYDLLPSETLEQALRRMERERKFT